LTTLQTHPQRYPCKAEQLTKVIIERESKQRTLLLPTILSLLSTVLAEYRPCVCVEARLEVLRIININTKASSLLSSNIEYDVQCNHGNPTTNITNQYITAKESPCLLILTKTNHCRSFEADPSSVVNNSNNKSLYPTSRFFVGITATTDLFHYRSLLRPICILRLISTTPIGLPCIDRVFISQIFIIKIFTIG